MQGVVWGAETQAKRFYTAFILVYECKWIFLTDVQLVCMVAQPDGL